MIRYLGFNIYSVVIFKGGQRWRVQEGYSVLGDYKTIGAAKAACTRARKKGLACDCIKCEIYAPVTKLSEQCKKEITEFCALILSDLRKDAREFGEACITVACDNIGEAWNYQTGDNSYTGACYSLPHWAVFSFGDSGADDISPQQLSAEIIEQLNDRLAGF